MVRPPRGNPLRAGRPCGYSPPSSPPPRPCGASTRPSSRSEDLRPPTNGNKTVLYAIPALGGKQTLACPSPQRLWNSDFVLLTIKATL